MCYLKEVPFVRRNISLMKGTFSVFWIYMNRRLKKIGIYTNRKLWYSEKRKDIGGKVMPIERI